MNLYKIFVNDTYGGQDQLAVAVVTHGINYILERYEEWLIDVKLLPRDKSDYNVMVRNVQLYGHVTKS
jgi:hypothetical protein